MSLNILLVDDSITVRAVLKKTLRLAEVPCGTILEAGDGLQALELLKTHQVDLMFTDLIMPNMGGEELLGRMAELGLIGKVPVVVVSSAAGEPRMRRLQALGADGFVHKPFTPETIRDVVEATMEVKSK